MTDTKREEKLRSLVRKLRNSPDLWDEEKSLFVEAKLDKAKKLLNKIMEGKYKRSQAARCEKICDEVFTR
jgi:hypothetical protein